MAQDQDPARANQWAQIRLVWETLRPREVLRLAEERAIHWRPKTGYQWLPQGTQTEVLTPGTHEKHDWAGAGDSRTGVVHDRGGPRTTHVLFRDLRDIPERRSASRR